jgi:hypothetical protein
LALRDLTHENFALVVPGDDARRGARALLVHDDLGLTAFHDSHAAVRRSEVDADDPTHGYPPTRFTFGTRETGALRAGLPWKSPSAR